VIPAKLRQRRTKIIATLGPATSEDAVLEKLLLAGVDAVRLNFSHGTHEDHARQIESVRRVSDGLGRPVAVIQDLQGPKIRLGTFEDGRLELPTGGRTTLVADDGRPGDVEHLPFSYPELSRFVTPGDLLLLKDGSVRLRIQDVETNHIRANIEAGGVVTDRAGVNVPGVSLDVDSMTPKDLEDLAFGTELGVDFVALSFVRTAYDVRLLRLELEKLGGRARVISKIEKREALEHVDEIIQASDGVMIARGDLGVEIPPEEVPHHQKEIIRKSIIQGRTVITATQMLESMTTSPTPTRAEASDVANAVYDGTAVIMLSGETAVGHYPVDTVRTMDRIARHAEDHLWAYRDFSVGELLSKEPPERLPSTGEGITEAISHAATHLSENLGAMAIVTPTTSGATARQVSRFRPDAPIIATTPDTTVQRQLTLEWGVTPLLQARAQDTDSTTRGAVQAAVGARLLRTGDLVIVTGGTRPNVPGHTDFINVETA